MCNYKQVVSSTIMIVSLFLGSCGIDRCILGCHNGVNGTAVCLGFLKGITMGGAGIWAIVDFILIILGSRKDGNGNPLAFPQPGN